MRQSKRPDAVKKQGKDPTSDVLKKMSSISDATKVLASEVKTMSKIFADNQKILVSLKNMIDAVNTSLEQIQKNSRQITILEEDTQRLFTGMNQVKAHSNIIDKINDQVNKLHDHVGKIREKQESIPDTNKIMQTVADNLDSIRNNTKMIMHVSEKTEKIREELKNVAKAGPLPDLTKEIDEIKQNTRDMSAKAEKMSHLEESISNLKTEIGQVVKKTEPIINLESQIRNVGVEIGALMKKTDSLSTLSNDIRNVNTQFSNFKENVLGKTKELDEKMTDFAEMLNSNSASISEFNKKTYEISQQLNDIRNVTHKTSQNTSREVIGLLRLSEFQSNIRMRSESKYGTLEDIEKMVAQTVDMINLFDRLSIEAETKMPLPLEVKQWSVSKLLDCADRWEIRFTDVFRLLISQLGSDLVKESIRMEQVRDLFGIRAVDEVRHELNIS
ncbi:Chromosome partition protein Smc [uncultured archaeon]|nr:Chromosome partition protein Smc [uncultured archaeon]